MAASGRSRRVICTHQGRGPVHEFAPYGRSNVEPHESLAVPGDSGYQGPAKLHEKSERPRKKPRESELTDEQKQAEREAASRRVVVEHGAHILRGIILLQRFDFIGIKHRRVITSIQDETFQGGVLTNHSYPGILRILGIAPIYKARHVETRPLRTPSREVERIQAGGVDPQLTKDREVAWKALERHNRGTERLVKRLRDADDELAENHRARAFACRA